jgi:hypothetical protein
LLLFLFYPPNRSLDSEVAGRVSVVNPQYGIVRAEMFELRLLHWD